MNFESTLNKFNYHLPPELIAQKPSRPRESARLLVYNKNTNEIFFDTYKNIGKYLPKNCVLVFNQTKVLPARITVTKESGGKSEILYISHKNHEIKVLSSKKLNPGSYVNLNSTKKFLVLKKVGQFYLLKPIFKINNIKSFLMHFGNTPLPPYIKNSPLSEKQRRTEYQTVFAKEGLSVAAPTASLHFSKKLIFKLKKQGIDVQFVTLNVNMGTFATLKEENLATGKLHSEFYEINKKTAENLNKAKKLNKPIVAVGTTVVRTLESASQNKKIKLLRGNTKLFIQPGYKFNFVDGLVTNFHVPKSSLLMLVSAIIGRKKLLELYRKAIEKKLKFFSFGDGMIII